MADIQKQALLEKLGRAKKELRTVEDRKRRADRDVERKQAEVAEIEKALEDG